MAEVTRDDLVAALDGFYVAVRTRGGHQESGQVASPDEVAGALHATLSRIAAERRPGIPAGAAGGPHAREIGRVTDGSGHVVIVGVDHDAVTVRTLSAAAVTLGPYRTEELGQTLISAAWQAGWHQGQQATRDGAP